MKLSFSIANRYCLLGLVAVSLTAAATGVGFMWQEFLTLRTVQSSFVGAATVAGQMELQKQMLENEVLSGKSELPPESSLMLRMRLQAVDVPPVIRQLGLRVEIAGPRQTEGGEAMQKSPFIMVFETDEDWLLTEPEYGQVQDLIYRAMAGTSLVFSEPETVLSFEGLFGKGDWLITAAPLYNQTGMATGVFVARQPLVMPRHLVAANRMMVPVLGACIGLVPGVIGFFLLGRGMSRRRKEMEQGLKALRSGNYAIRLPGKGFDDFAVLQRDFNATATFIQTEDKRKNDLIADFEETKKGVQVATAAKGDFLANMSHEIRTPMNGIIGTTSLLIELGLEPEQEELVKMIRSSGESLLHMINDILDFSKIESAKMELEELPVDLETLLGETVDVLGYRAAEKGLELNFSIDSHLPKKLVGDFQRIKQILVNLIGNAVKFTEKGEILVLASQVSRKTERGESTFLHLSVRDTGIGIPNDKLTQIFEAFTQVDVSTTRKYGGTGLGLAISRRLCRMMGGDVGCVSEEGKGSDFYFEIPLQVSPDDSAREAEMEALDLVGGRVLHYFSVHPTTAQILHQTALQWKMRPVAIKPATLVSSVDLAETLSDANPAAVLLDISGLESSQAQPLLRTAAGHRIPIVTLLPLTGAKSRDQFLPPEGAVHLKLLKPMKPQELLRGLAALLKKPAGSGSSARASSGAAFPTAPMQAPPALQQQVVAETSMGAQSPNAMPSMMSAPGGTPMSAAQPMMVAPSPAGAPPAAPTQPTMAMVPPAPVEHAPTPTFTVSPGAAPSMAMPVPEPVPSAPPVATAVAGELAPAPIPSKREEAPPSAPGSRAASGYHDVEVSDSTNRAISKAANANGASFASQHPARILLVEDQPLNQKISSMLLQRLGYEQIDIANHGQEAVTLVSAGAYDVIFMDLQMPVMGGIDATQNIRANFQLRHQPAIIAMTGHALTGVKEECRAVGMNAFLTKPVSLDDFRRVIPPSLEANAASTPMVVA